jgi:NAD(P)-dependent dehydrogenase (short-subunit alcohol dehydrogenase family)
MKRLEGKVCVVAGATRGAGRGIATELGAAGATVYCVGRTTRESQSPMQRPETIEETADLVTAHGGVGIPVRVDCTVRAEVEALFERVRVEQSGRLDVLVNDVWGGESMVAWDVPSWEMDVEQGLRLLNQAVCSHILLSRYGVPLMVARNQGVVFEVTDGDSYYWRGSYFYDLVKVNVIRLAQNLHEEFKARKLPITSLAITPGYLRSEEMLAFKGLTESTWRDGIAVDANWAFSETPRYIGRAVAALAADPEVNSKSGQALATWHLYKEYGFRDLDTTTPDWEANHVKHAE